MTAEQPTILIVDDEADLRRITALVLSRAGYAVETAADGQAGVEAFFEHEPDVVVLDVNMPRLNGWQALDRIRQSSDVPVLMLTAQTAETDRVRGLRSGADDYLVKPFGKQELVARIEVMLRRQKSKAQVDEVYEDSFLHLDLRRHSVEVDGRQVELTPLEFKLLAVLTRHAGSVLSREQLRELVWGDTQALSPEQVKLYVSYLRRKLGDPNPIETVRGAGYRYMPQD